jgi:hypothetical protein
MPKLWKQLLTICSLAVVLTPMIITPSLAGNTTINTTIICYADPNGPPPRGVYAVTCNSSTGKIQKAVWCAKAGPGVVPTQCNANNCVGVGGTTPIIITVGNPMPQLPTGVLLFDNNGNPIEGNLITNLPPPAQKCFPKGQK